MTLLVPTHALPLIPPADIKITIAQCDAEIKALQESHCKALVDFWGSLKKGGLAPSSHWNNTQRDLHQLFHAKDQLTRQGNVDAPDHNHASGIWNEVIAEFDEAIQAKLQMLPFASFDLVAIITQDQDVTVAHRYQGEHVYNIAEDDLSAKNEDGPNWFFKSRLYEPIGLGSGPYQVPSLYLIGTIDKDTQEWAPKAVTPGQRYEISDIVEAMESLIEHNRLGAWMDMALPAFPSGVETRLQELSMLRAWLREKSYPAADERSAVTAARAAFTAPIEQLQNQIEALKKELQTQVKLQDRSGLQAKLTFHGFELGQQVTRASSGETGVLSMTDEFHPTIFVDIEGKFHEKWASSNQFEYEMRLGEWSAVPPAQEEDDSMHDHCERP